MDWRSDINSAAAAALHDMAVIQTSKPRAWAYGQAASTVRTLDTQLDRLAGSGTLPKIPHIGPASSRIIFEVLESGRSDTVERAIDESGRRRDVEQRRAWRANFLSRAAALTALDERGTGLRAHHRSDFQMHSTWSDGRQTLEDIVEGCLARGYTHAAVTDHSGGLPIARGLPPERMRAQGLEIQRINKAYEGRFRLLQGVEANIGADGTVDVDLTDRLQLDLVVAAPHSGLRTDDPQTTRMVAVVRTRGVHILGHPRGRKYGARPGIAAEWREVFAAAAENGVAIEIDGDPSRQDVDFELAHMAVESGCLLALDSDAHAVDELAYVDLALAHAALAEVPADRVINTWPLDRLLEWMDARRG